MLFEQMNMIVRILTTIMFVFIGILQVMMGAWLMSTGAEVYFQLNNPELVKGINFWLMKTLGIFVFFTGSLYFITGVEIMMIHYRPNGAEAEANLNGVRADGDNM